MWDILVEIVLPVGGTVAVLVTFRRMTRRRVPRKQRKLL